MSDLPEFLLARFAEDEQQVARSWPFSNAKIAAECDAKRRIVAEFREAEEAATRALTVDEQFDVGREFALEGAMGLLALPYADHPDYDEAWRP